MEIRNFKNSNKLFLKILSNNIYLSYFEIIKISFINLKYKICI